EAIKRIGTGFIRMLLPIGIMLPDAVRLLHVILLNRFHEAVDSMTAAKMRPPVPWPIGRVAGDEPEDHDQNEKKPSAAVKQHAISPVAGLVKLRSIEQGH